MSDAALESDAAFASDTASDDPAAGQFIATLANALDEKTNKSGPQTGLRQLLQMLAPLAGQPGPSVFR